MKINTPYNLGDTVWAVVSRTSALPPIPCEACDKAKKVRLKDGIDYPCPACWGRGEFRRTELKYAAKAVCIKSIRIIEDEDSRPVIEYEFPLDRDETDEENEVFPTKEAADKYIAKILSEESLEEARGRIAVAKGKIW